MQSSLEWLDDQKKEVILRPGNGNEFHYKRYNGIYGSGMYFDADTPDEVARALSMARSCGTRIRIHYGETDPKKPDFGRDWNEENDVTGYVGASCGELCVPLMMYSRRSSYGPHILDDNIVKIRNTGVGGNIIYVHPNYKEPVFTLREIGAEERCGKENLRDMGYTHGVDIDGRNYANFKKKSRAIHYIHKMSGKRFSENV